MPKFTIEVRDRATIDIMAVVEVEADTYEAAVERIENADPMNPADQDLCDLEWEMDEGLGWWDRHGEQEYKVFPMPVDDTYYRESEET